MRQPISKEYKMDNYTNPDSEMNRQNIRQCRKIYTIIAFTLTASYLVTYGIVYLISYLIAPVLQNGSLGLPASTITAILNYWPMYVICFPLILLVLSRLKKSSPEINRLGAKSFIKYFSVCFPILLVGSIIGNVLSMLLSNGQSQNDLTGLLSAIDPVVIITTTILAPVFEELVFRKAIIDRTKQYGEFTAVFFSALCFGLFHMNFFQFFYSFGIGLLFGYVYIRTGKIRYTIIMHFIVNSLSSIVVPFLLAKSDYYNFMEMLQQENIEGILSSGTLIWVLIYMMYSSLYFAAICFGVVMFCTNIKKIRFNSQEGELKKSTGMKAALLNIGTIVYFLLSAVLFTLYLFKESLFQ